MQVTQPNEFYKGLPKEDVFFVKDDQNNPVGEGFLIYQYQPTDFPFAPGQHLFQHDQQAGRRILAAGVACGARAAAAQSSARCGGHGCTQPWMCRTTPIAFYEHNGFKMVTPRIWCA